MPDCARAPTRSRLMRDVALAAPSPPPALHRTAGCSTRSKPESRAATIARPALLDTREPAMAYIDNPATQRANLGFIKASMRMPLLSRDRELSLARRWRDGDDTEALHELVRAYTRLVVSLAARFRSYGLPMGDLVQEGNVGLMQAAARFEPERGVRFSTYAAWWIRSAMQDYILRNWSIVRTGTTAAQKSLFFNLRRLRAKIDDVSGRPLSPESKTRIAKELRVEVADVEAMEIRLGAADQSLNAPVSDGA